MLKKLGYEVIKYDGIRRASEDTQQDDSILGIRRHSPADQHFAPLRVVAQSFRPTAYFLAVEELADHLNHVVIKVSFLAPASFPAGPTVASDSDRSPNLNVYSIDLRACQLRILASSGCTLPRRYPDRHLDYKHKVVTLIAFDLKGAFNGVNSVSLDAALQARGIPIAARKWIASFMSDRHANIGFDDFRTETKPLANAGLAQGSPLSPILFVFFYVDLVDQPVNSHGGASAFIDDYFRWRVGRSAEENLAKIQSEDFPRIEEWARRTGSCFAAEKTELIHLTRKRGEHLGGTNHLQWSRSQAVTYSQTAGGSARPGTSLEGTRSAGHQTGYQDDYRAKWTRTLTPRTNATALPSRKNAFTEIEIEPDRETARERAVSAKDTSDIIVYSDASGRKGHLGAAIVTLNDNEEVIESQQVQVGPMERWSVHVAELIGIFYAVDMVFKLAHQRTNVEDGVQSTATILCDSRSALQAIQNVKNRSGQRIIHAILQAAAEVQGVNVRLRRNGCQDIVKSQGTTLQTDWPKKLRNRLRMGHNWLSS
ncbi:hypothetical protein PENANT_c197G02441 [Penicillium antarcticum]|uniref:Reverse transcriptase domain-containing protein n=1 Tax=Penicillium antarcticum TaxID=416450 RepID=A0A1V6PAJ0_9EURO|nr:hypothetical protein PENANT_c197G02441 [Penicillium antarcticum]